jgi:O-antigen/teichoic acid export membrane protein
VTTGTEAPAHELPSATSSLRRFTTNRVVGQAVLFAGATVFVSLLSAVAKALVARELPASSFGTYSFTISFLLLGALIFEFGFFAPAARLAAQAEERSQARRIFGASLLIYIPIGLAFSVAIFASSFVVESWFGASSGHVLRIVAPFAFVFPFVEISLWLAQGMDRLHVYSVVTGFSRVLFVASLVAFFALESHPSVSGVVVLQALSILAGAIVLILWLRPLIRDARAHVGVLIRDAKAFGMQIYVGRLLSIGTYNMDILMLAAWADARHVGLYALAGAVAAATGLPIAGMANALYPRMTRVSALNRSWFVIAWLIAILLALVAWLLAKPFFRVVFSAEYVAATRYLAPLLLAQIVRSVTGLYNNFFSANGLGKEMRNTGLVLTASNVILNFALIPRYGAMGAAWASFLALLANFLGYVYYYRRAVRAAALRP